MSAIALEEIDQYKPYRALPNRQGFGGNNLVFMNVTDLQRAQKLSVTVAAANDETRVRLAAEKLALKQISQQRVKSWGNTILGQRKRRLAHRAEQERLAEEQRQKADADWSKTLGKERAQRIEQARLMQYVATAPIRELHSKMLLSNVLHERQLQLVHKKAMEQRQREYDEYLAAKIKSVERHTDEATKAENARLARIENSIHQRDEAEKKRLERIAERKAVRAYHENMGQALAEELKREAEEAKLRKKELIKETQAGLAKVIVDKKAVIESRSKEDALLCEENEAFTNMKAVMATKKKDFETTKQSQRDHMSHTVAKMNLELIEERDEERKKFLATLLNAHNGRAEKREAEELAKQQRFMRELHDFIAMKCEETQRIKDQKLREHIKEKEVVSRLAVEVREDGLKEVAKKKKGLRELRDFHKTQITDGKKREEERIREVHKIEKQMAEAEVAEKQRFQEYSDAVIQEYRMSGKNLQPIIRSLRKPLPFPPPEFNTRYDTFERLGFTVRDVPTFPPISDPWKRKAGL